MVLLFSSGYPLVTHWFPGTLARLFRKCGREKDSQTDNANLGFQRVFFWGEMFWTQTRTLMPGMLFVSFFVV